MRKKLILLTITLLFLANCQEINKKPVIHLKPLNIVRLEQVIQDAENLYNNSEIGNNEGQYSAENRILLREAIRKARLSTNSTSKRQYEATAQLSDDCMRFESTVISQRNGLTDQYATKETRYLYENLKRIAPDEMLFGMHDATGYGVGWEDDDKRSDVKDVCGSLPALFSWDMYTIFKGNKKKCVSFRDRILDAHNQGGITSICWHQYDPVQTEFSSQSIKYKPIPQMLPGGKYHEYYKTKLKNIALFVKTLRGESGESVPIIFRPYHEQNGNWFWWGKTYRMEQEFIEFWQFTVEYLRDSLGVHNFIYAFSPDGNQYEQKADYLIDYPGDDFVDILGMDYYFGSGDAQDIDRFKQRVVHIVEYAEERNKVAAITEVGDRKGWNTSQLLIEKWFTHCLLNPVKNDKTSRKIVYASVWRNESEQHHFAPYPGHSSVPDFIEFYNDSFTVFLDNLDNMFINNPTNR